MIQKRLYSEDKLYSVVDKFGKLIERKKLRVNEGMGKVIRCSRFVNVGLMDARQNGGTAR